MIVNTDKLAHWVNLKQIIESRGNLTEVDFNNLPFVPVRTFFITHVPVSSVRGGHAHKQGDQILLCLSGRIEVEMKYQNRQQTVICQPNGLGLFLKQGVWAKQTYLETDSILLVFCSHVYNSDSYISEKGRSIT